MVNILQATYRKRKHSAANKNLGLVAQREKNGKMKNAFLFLIENSCQLSKL